MKKIILTLALILVTSFSFANQTYENRSLENENRDCLQYAINSAALEANAYEDYSQLSFLYNFTWYYDACKSVDGNIEDPVFL